MDSDWAGLPRELVDSILERFVLVSDYIRFGAVCKAWHSAAMEKINYLLPPQLPMLFVPSHTKDVWNLYSIKDNKLLPLQFPIPYCTREFVGSSNGWLVTEAGLSSIHLFNPLYLVPGKQITCNPKARIIIDKPMNVFVSIRKATLSAKPTSTPGDYMIMVLYGTSMELSLITPNRYRQWTGIRWSNFQDIIYHQDHFYALDLSGNLFYYNETNEQCFQYWTQNHTRGFSKKYLVETIAGELLLVERITKWHEEGVFHHKVMKLNKIREGWVWMEVKSIGDCALFLGDNTPLSVVASKFPGCQPNSIYFAYMERGPMGVYNMESGTFTPFNMLNDLRLACGELRPPMWIVPSF